MKSIHNVSTAAYLTSIIIIASQDTSTTTTCGFTIAPNKAMMRRHQLSSSPPSPSSPWWSSSALHHNKKEPYQHYGNGKQQQQRKSPLMSKRRRRISSSTFLSMAPPYDDEYEYEYEDDEDEEDDDEISYIDLSGTSFYSSSGKASTSKLSSVMNSMQQQPLLDYAWSNQLDPPMKSKRTMGTALCLIPPDSAWDTIQRARHMARDETLYQWPPAIRLFHPFAPQPYLASAATALSELVEKYQLDSFEVTMSEFVILPNLELLDQFYEEDLFDDGIDGDGGEDEGDGVEERELTREEKDMEEVKRLIDNEERIGREKLAKRREKERMKAKENRDILNNINQAALDAADMSSSSTNNPTTTSNNNQQQQQPQSQQPPKKKRKRRITKAEQQRNSQGMEHIFLQHQKHRRTKNEYDGPCIICLEPDEDSRNKLEALRQLMGDELFGVYDAFSISSSALPPAAADNNNNNGNNRGGRKDDRCDYRPIITIGRFPTVTAAIEVAKRLKTLWEPLTFAISDFHFVSCGGGANAELSSTESVAGATGHGYSKSDSHGGIVASAEVKDLQSNFQYGCDAMVMLMNEDDDDVDNEEELDDDESQNQPSDYNDNDDDDATVDDWIDLMCQQQKQQDQNNQNKNNTRIDEKGTIIDYDAIFRIKAEEAMQNAKQQGTQNMIDYMDDDQVQYVESLLPEEEDDWNEGATIVIGRTQYFLGGMREYVGMPASNPMDGKDRVLGQGVNGMARRKGSVHRQGDRWCSGDYGTKEADDR